MDEQNTQPANDVSASSEASQVDTQLKFKKVCVVLGFVLLSVFLLGMLYLSGIEPNPEGGKEYGYSTWLMIAYLAGLSMIFLPCTFPLVFVIVPLCLGKDYKKGLFMAVLFGLGLSITLSLYGVGIAFIGNRVGLDQVTETIFIIAGIAAYFLALSELGFVKFKIPTYSGQIPTFIQKQNDYLKTFFLGLFLGNAGVGCPNPWFYFMLAYIARAADVEKGFALGFVHGVGRSVPLILLAVLGLLGVNYTKQILKNKEKVEKALGWILVFVAAFILVNGVFSHKWYVQSGIHTFWEKGVRVVMSEKFGERIEHGHEVLSSTFYTFGNYVLVGLFVLPMLWYFVRRYIVNIKRKAFFELILRALVVVVFFGSLYPFFARFSDSDSTRNLYGLVLGIFGIIVFYFWGREECAVLCGAKTITDEQQVAQQPVIVDEVEMRKKINAMLKIIVTAIILFVLFVQYFPKSVVAPKLKHQVVVVDAGTKSDITAQGVNINFALNPVLPVIGQPTVLKFTLKDEKTGVAIETLEKVHTKEMHLMLVREDLTNFNHLHPVFKDGAYTIEHTFSDDGYYKTWINFEHGNAQRVVGFEFQTEKSKGRGTDQVVSGVNLKKTVLGYNIELTDPKQIKTNKETNLEFIITDTSGKIIKLSELEDYLGAKGHLIIISQDLNDFGHGHIEGGHAEGGGKHGFKIIKEVYASGGGHATTAASVENLTTKHMFKQVGLYRIWLEFQIAGQMVRSDFTVAVE